MEKKDKKNSENLQGPGVMEKYKKAGEIAQNVMKELLQRCVDGADVNELCIYGNKRINEECAKIYNNKKIPKGVAFPVCVSPNDICGHFAPLKDESFKLSDGDMVKVDLGVHFDGYTSVLAHTLLIGDKKDEMKQKAASAAFHALKNVVKMLRPENTNKQGTYVMGKVIETFGVKPMSGVLSHELKRFEIDGENVMISCNQGESKVNTFKFDKDQVFALDVIVSADELGKSKESELRTTVFKKNSEMSHGLKTKVARHTLTEVQNRFGEMAFSLNDFEDPKKSRIGLSECLKSQLIQPFNVLQSKSKAPVAQFKWTVAISAKRVLLFSSLQELNFELLPLGKVKEEKEEKLAFVSNEELSKILETPLVEFTTKKKNKKK